MSYNNGIVSAHTDEELERALGWAISNPAGSGVADVFGEWAPIVRPQECMFTGSQIPVYRGLGIDAISLYCSALPFNAFSIFVAPLPFAHRYNPLRLHSSMSGEEITLLPAYNHGDIADHWVSLRSWLRTMGGLNWRPPANRKAARIICFSSSIWMQTMTSGPGSICPSLAGSSPPLVGSTGLSAR